MTPTAPAPGMVCEGPREVTWRLLPQGLEGDPRGEGQTQGGACAVIPQLRGGEMNCQQGEEQEAGA